MRLEEVISGHDIEDIVTGLRGSRESRWGLCPLPMHIHSHRPTPSFSVFWYRGKQHWKCHGQCNLSGDILDLVGYMRMYDYDRSKEKRLEAAEILSGGEFKVNPPIEPPPSPILPAWLATDMFPPSPEAIEYAHKRGITDEQIEIYKLGTPKFWMSNPPYNVHNPEKWLAFPTFHHDDLFGIKLRNTQSSSFRYMSVKGSRKGLYGYNDVWLTEEPVLVVKGEIAKLVATRFGFLACAPTGGEGSYVDSVRQALALAKVIVVADNDANPETDRKMKEAAFKRSVLFNGVLKTPPPEYKDIDEFLLAEPERAVQMINRWIEESKNGLSGY